MSTGGSEPLPLDQLLAAAPAVEKDFGFGDFNAPPPPELSPRDLERHSKEFEEYCKVTDDRGTMVAAWARCYELPPEKAFEIIRDVYAPRCAALNPPQPWSDDNIVHKLEQVYGGILHADFVFAKDAPRLPPEGWFERMMGHVAPDPDKKPSLRPDGRELEDNCARPTTTAEKIPLASLISDLRSHKDWEGVLRYNDLSKYITATENAPVRLDAQTSSLTDVDITRIRAWLERRGKKASKEDAFDAVYAVANENKYNPILDYLDSLPQVDRGPIEQIALRGLGNITPLAQEVIVKTLVGAVRRMRYPGTKIDTMLVLRGPQGVKKSMFIAALFGEKYVKSQMPDLASKDASLGLRGFWCVELAELDRIIRAESSTVKEFLSRLVDSFREPYGRAEAQFPRMGIFMGTTNDKEILVDTTGNRRFIVIETEACDPDWIRANRDAIWAAANALEAAGVPHWFDDEAKTESLRAPYEVIDPWEATVRDHCAGRPKVGNATEIYLEAIARGDTGALARVDRRIRVRITAILRKLGCVERRTNGKHWWDVAPGVQDEAPSEEEAKRREAIEAIKKLKRN